MQKKEKKEILTPLQKAHLEIKSLKETCAKLNDINAGEAERRREVERVFEGIRSMLWGKRTESYREDRPGLDQLQFEIFKLAQFKSQYEGAMIPGHDEIRRLTEIIYCQINPARALESKDRNENGPEDGYYDPRAKYPGRTLR